MYNNILISLSESSKNFRLSLEFTSGESFRDFITVFDFRHSWILVSLVTPVSDFGFSTQVWYFGFWILDFGHYGSIFIDQNLDVNVRFMALLIVETSL